MNPVIHFEMPMEDKARTKKFYEDVFGWHMNQLGEEMGSYLLAGTSPVDDKMMHKEKGAINGGFYPRGQAGNSTTHVVISVPDIKKHIDIVKKAGGVVEGEPAEIQGIGTYVMFNDPEGNRVGMLQPAATS